VRLSPHWLYLFSLPPATGYPMPEQRLVAITLLMHRDDLIFKAVITATAPRAAPFFALRDSPDTKANDRS
jgi:hypothetical protein